MDRALLATPCWRVIKELKRLDVVLVLVDCSEWKSKAMAELKRMGRNYLPYDVIAPRNESLPLIGLPDLTQVDDFKEALQVAAN